MLRNISMFLLVLSFTSTLVAQSPAKLYLQVLNACGAGPDQKKLVWLGTTNNEGPGSIWTLNDGPALKARASTYFKTTDELNAALGLPGDLHASPCNGVKSPKWSLSADVPISVTGIGNAEASLSVSKSTTITATATSVSWIAMPSLTLENAINAQPHDDPNFFRVADGHSYAMLSAYSVQGLQITYTLDSALSATAKASIQASSTVNVGTSTTPLNASLSVTNDGQKVTISIPDAHYAFGEMTPISMLSHSQTEKGRVTLGKRQWITTCRTAGLC